MSKQRKLLLIAAAVGIISMFLPWISVSVSLFGTELAGGSLNGMRGSGILVFLCFAAAGALALVGNQTTNLSSTNWLLTLVAGGVAALIMVINFFDSSGSGLLSFGFYGALLASLAVVAFAFLFRSSTDTLQGGFDSLKNSLGSRVAEGPATNATGTTTTVSHTSPTDETSRPTV